MLTDDNETQPNALVPFAGLDAGDPEIEILPPSVTDDAGLATAIAHYDGMLTAISLCVEAPEAKFIYDKYTAAQFLARKVRNREAEQQVREVRLNALRKLGELLAANPVAKGGKPYQSKHTSGKTDNIPTLKELGISADESALAKRLAQVPAKIFTSAVKSPEMPSLRSILRAVPETVAGNPKKTTKLKVDGDDQITAFWERTRDLAAMAKTLNRKGAAELGSKSKHQRQNLGLALGLLTNIDDLMGAK